MANRRRLHSWLRAVFFVAATVAVGLLFAFPPRPLASLLRHGENVSLRLRFQQRGALPPPPEIVIVGLDDSSFRVQEFPPEDFLVPEVREWMTPRLPWDRRFYAACLDRLLDAGARVVAFDFLFVGETEVDPVFAAAIARAPHQVVLGQELTYRTDELGQVHVHLADPSDLLFPEEGPEPGLGIVNVFPDDDQVLRSTRLGFHFRLESVLANGQLESFAGDAAALAPTDTGLAWSTLRSVRPDLPEPSVLERSWINYYGPQGVFPMIPAEALFMKGRWDGRLLRDGAYFRDKLVLVGPISEIRFKDMQTTPFGITYGVETHATLLGNLIEDRFLVPVPPRASLAIYLGLLAWGLFGLLVFRRAVNQSLILVAGAVAFIVFAQVAFSVSNRLVSVATPLGAYGALAALGILFDFVQAQRDRYRIKRMFGTYLAPELVNEMVESGEDPELGGVESEITAFFTDVQGFSSFSEKLGARDLVTLMNEYLGAMTEILQQEGGALDKYIGDAIVAIFGAPVRRPDHAVRACRTALRMQSRLAELRLTWQKQGPRWPVLVHHMRMRIGIHTGVATVGNLGSSRRFNYTMMGDSVNLAARCESGAKQAGVFTLVTAETRDQVLAVTDEMVFRILDRWRVKGRKEPVEICELVGFRRDLTQSQLEGLKAYESALQLYGERRFGEAALGFEAASRLEVHQPDPAVFLTTNPSLILRDRCLAWSRNPPPRDWDGVYQLESK